MKRTLTLSLALNLLRKIIITAGYIALVAIAVGADVRVNKTNFTHNKSLLMKIKNTSS